MGIKIDCLCKRADLSLYKTDNESWRGFLKAREPAKRFLSIRGISLISLISDCLIQSLTSLQFNQQEVNTFVAFWPYRGPRFVLVCRLLSCT